MVYKSNKICIIKNSSNIVFTSNFFNNQKIENKKIRKQIDKMESICIWTINIHNCNIDKTLKINVIIGLVINTILCLFYIYIVLKRIINKEWNKIFDFKNKKFRFSESVLIVSIIIHIFLIVHLLLLLFASYKVNSSLTIFQVLPINLLLISGNDCNLSVFESLSYKNNIRKILIPICLILFLSSTIFSILSGIFFYRYDSYFGHIFLGIQFILQSIHIIFSAIISVYYWYNINIDEDILIDKKIQRRIKELYEGLLSGGISLFIIGLFWFIQTIFLFINFENYENNIGLIMIITTFNYYLSLSIYSISTYLYDEKIE